MEYNINVINLHTNSLWEHMVFSLESDWLWAVKKCKKWHPKAEITVVGNTAMVKVYRGGAPATEEEKSRIAEQSLTAIADDAMAGCKEARTLLEEIWEEKWGVPDCWGASIKQKLKTEESTWVVWWGNGVAELMARNIVVCFPYFGNQKKLENWV